MNIAVAITAAPRPGPSPLPQCIESVRLAGLPRPMVFAEPGSAGPDESGGAAEVVHRPKRRGECGNWLQSLQDVLAARPQADAVLIVQDDVVLSRGLCGVLTPHLWPSERCGLVQLCTSVGYATQRIGLTVLPRDALRCLLGAWACLFPRRAAERVLEYSQVAPWKPHPADSSPSPVDRRGIDMFIGLALGYLRYEVWTCRPSLGLHCDVPSALGHGGSNEGNRRTLDFVPDAAGWPNAQPAP